MQRADAIAALARRRLASLSEADRAEQLGCMLNEHWSGAGDWPLLDPSVRDELENKELAADPADPRYDAVLLMWLHSELAPVTNAYLEEQLGVDEVSGEPDRLESCPCCGRRTLGERSINAICPVCWWEDDGQDNDDADAVTEGPNHHLSLTQARANYLRHGLADPKRDDLRAHQSPPHMYESGRQFILAGDELREVGSRWRSQSFDLE